VTREYCGFEQVPSPVLGVALTEDLSDQEGCGPLTAPLLSVTWLPPGRDFVSNA
jgi:hypothetical protein